MNKKVLVAGLSAVAVLVAGIIVLVVLLFGGQHTEASVSKKSEALFCAVPSNAVAVVKFSDLHTGFGKTAVPAASSDGADAFVRKFASALDAGEFRELSERPLVVALTYSKKTVPLFIFDAGRADDGSVGPDVAKVSSLASECGMSFTDCDCSKILSVDGKLRDRRILLVSSSVNLVNSSLRHLNDGVSIYDSKGFADVQGRVSGRSSLFVSVSDADQMLPEILGPSLRKCSRFLTAFSGWAGFELTFTDSGAELHGTALPERQTDFINVLSGLEPARSELCGILPSSTVRAISFPLKSPSASIDAYEGWLDKRMKLDAVKRKRKSLASACGVSPEDWLASLQPAEVAVASFVSGDTLCTVNLVRGRKTGDVRETSPFDKPGFLSSLFGELFDRGGNENFHVTSGGWLITGSRAAVEEWASGRVAERSLYSRLCDAGLKSSIPASGIVTAYFSADMDASLSTPTLSSAASSAVAGRLAGHDMMPAFMCVSRDRKGGASVDMSVLTADIKRPPVREKGEDADISVPEGPFTVKNSATGRNNTFVQNGDLSLSLVDRDGKGLWTVPFSGKLCGYVSGIDYFANGKIQFIFAAGSKVYLMDRLGNFVKPFPLDLGKKIVLGPAVYDFNGARRYNILVLHDDNTIRMYNLKGEVPAGWTDITSEEPVVALPERVVSGSKSVWRVRTSRRTLTFPFMGGAPLADGGTEKQ